MLFKVIAAASRIVALLGPHEVVSLVAFGCTIVVWAVTLGVIYR